MATSPRRRSILQRASLPIPNFRKRTTSPTREDGNSNSGRRMTYQERVLQYSEAIAVDTIDITRIRELAFEGVPEDFRPTYWKILLNYLPDNRRSWQDFLSDQRAQYKSFCKDFIIDPEELRELSTTVDDPLSNKTGSKWNEYFRDMELWKEVEKDVNRTHASLQFFSLPIPDSDEIHANALNRILFVYAKLNPGIKYVQGMNEVLAPIYYVFATDRLDPEGRRHAEGDSFFCFTSVMSEIRDNFCASLDRSDTGIQASIHLLNNLLELKDPVLYNNLAEKKIDTQFYGLRWISLLLSQEFELPDVLRLWDSLFSDERRFDFMTYVCAAMLICVRDRLIGGDFAENLKLLQSYPCPPLELAAILQRAADLRVPDSVELGVMFPVHSPAVEAASDPLTISPLQLSPATSPSSSNSLPLSLRKAVGGSVGSVSAGSSARANDRRSAGPSDMPTLFGKPFQM
eukprot:Rmarinus@m.27647